VMINPIDLSQGLAANFRKQLPLPAHIAAFAAWISHDSLCAMNDAIEEALSATDLGRRPDHAAALGYAIHAGELNAKALPLFASDTDQISGRKFFAPGRTPGFEADGAVLLGLALGFMSHSESAAAPIWFTKLLVQAKQHLAPDKWNLSLISVAQFVCGERNDLHEVASDLRFATSNRLALICDGECRRLAWSLACQSSAHGDGPTRDATLASIAQIALRQLASIPNGEATPESLATILQGVKRSMRLWTWEEKPRTAKSEIRKWNVDHEYHVQNLLWLILAPLIPDIEDEIYLPSLGQKTPRADLGVPSLRTIIEVKFIRDRGAKAFRKVIDEIASDASLYLTSKSSFDHLIAFLWDDLVGRFNQFARMRIL
jgi:hypothetical protein